MGWDAKESLPRSELMAVRPLCDDGVVKERA